MKRENDEISANEDDNRSSSQKHSDVKSRKRNEPENEAEDQHGTPNKKKARVSAMNLPPQPEPEPELGPANFNTLDDDCLGNVLDFVGKSCYSAFGRVNKRCNEIFCSKGLPKVSYLFGYAPLHIIEQRKPHHHPTQKRNLIKRQEERSKRYNTGFSKGVMYYNRRDIFEWILADESLSRLKRLCRDAIEESRLDILCEVFRRANVRQLEYLRKYVNRFDLCGTAARVGKVECMKLLRENECEWSNFTWRKAKQIGHDHILKYLRDNGYPSKWQD